MKVSIITVTYNAASTLAYTINSVASQDYHDLEYIVVDGGSKDDTFNVIQAHKNYITKWISEPDKGLYDAMNKGIKMATGDIIGIINADDFYHKENIISQVAEAFKEKGIQCVFADIQFVSPNDLNKVVRHYNSGRFTLESFKWGVMPAHPSFFTYRENFEKFSYYKTDYKIAADFELLARFLYKNKLSYTYLSIPVMKMRTGGLSTRSWKSTYIINKEDLRACRENGIKTNYLMLYSRYFRKVLEYLPFRRK